MKTTTAVRILISLLLTLHFSRAQKSSDDASIASLLGPQFIVSFLLLGLTAVLSSCIYLWVLRYVCIGCCQPIAVGAESEALARMV